MVSGYTMKLILLKEKSNGMKRTSYFNDLIVTYDNIFPNQSISMLEKDIQNVLSKWGTKDNPENPSTGLQCFSFEDTNVWQILWLETNKLDELQGYRYKRSNQILAQMKMLTYLTMMIVI